MRMVRELRSGGVGILILGASLLIGICLGCSRPASVAAVGGGEISPTFQAALQRYPALVEFGSWERFGDWTIEGQRRIQKLNGTPLYAEVTFGDVIQRHDGIYFEATMLIAGRSMGMQLKDDGGVLEPLIAGQQVNKRFAGYGVVFRADAEWIREWSAEDRNDRIRIDPVPQIIIRGNLLNVYPIALKK